MRDIRFRAWDKKNLKMMAHGKPYLFLDIEDGKVYRADIDDYSEDFIIMQFTGLHDKNGNPVYESDILGEDRDIIEVVKKTGPHGDYFALIVRKIGGLREIKRHIPGAKDDYCTTARIDECEVLGNIHEHPHLLEAK